MSGLAWDEQRRTTYRDGTPFKNHTPGRHNLLVRSRHLKVPRATLVGRCEGDVDAVDAHGHHGQLLKSVIVGGRCGPLRVPESVRLLDLRIGACTAKLCARIEVKRIGGGMNVSQTTRISERCGVDFHSLSRSYVDRCECNTASRVRIGF